MSCVVFDSHTLVVWLMAVAVCPEQRIGRWLEVTDAPGAVSTVDGCCAVGEEPLELYVQELVDRDQTL